MSHLDSSSYTISDSLQTWRESIIQGILYAMLGFGALAVIGTSIDILTQVEEKTATFPLFRVTLYILAYGFALFVTFFRRLLFAIRAGTPLVLLYCIGLTEFYLFGNSWEGFLLFFVVIALTTLLFGIRHGVFVLSVSISIMVIVVLATMLVQLDLPFEHRGSAINSSGNVASEKAKWLERTLLLQDYRTPYRNKSWSRI